MDQPAIRVSQLCKSYGQVMAVDNISFEIPHGQLVGFLGPNGAGKTTTMRMITTLLPATSGYAYVCGHDVMMESMAVRNHIGYLPESVPLYPEMKVEEYLSYRAKLKGVERSKRPARLDYCIELCRVQGVRRRLLATLSKGYRQRVGLADALLADPKVLILDEPTSGLDPIQIRETLSAIKQLAGQHTIMLSTHILSEVEAVCERVLIINRGRIRWDATMKQAAEDLYYALHVRGPVDAILEHLQRIDGIQSARVLESKDDIHSIDLVPHNKQDVREVISRTILERGWGLLELASKRRTVEAVYMDVVMSEEPEQAVA
ncbi:MAG: ATP-binding cassette domain-containing protein [Zavarzinella sp.]